MDVNSIKKLKEKKLNMNPRYRINLMLKNALYDLSSDRIAPFIHKNGLLTCYLLGAEKFEFNPQTKEIILQSKYYFQGTLIIQEKLIDKELCMALYEKTKPKAEVDKFAMDREDLHITGKVTEKMETQIKKYRDAFQTVRK